MSVVSINVESTTLTALMWLLAMSQDIIKCILHSLLVLKRITEKGWVVVPNAARHI